VTLIVTDSTHWLRKSFVAGLKCSDILNKIRTGIIKWIVIVEGGAN